MNTLSLMCLVGIGLLFFINLFFFLFGKQIFKGKAHFIGWKTQVIFFSLSTVLFFIYFTSTINSAGFVQTMNVGGDLVTVQDNSSREAFNYLYLLIAFEGMQLIFLVMAIFNDLKLLGRQRLSNDYDED